jgi:hypothetical protein
MPIITVAQKPNQGESGNSDVYLFPVAFFGTFFSTKESTRKNQQKLSYSNWVVKTQPKESEH